MCILFVLFYFSDTNTTRPCITDAIGASHQFPLPAACRSSRSNDGAPVPSARPQLSIHLHWPVPIGSTRTIYPDKPTPPSHFWTNTPISMSHYRIFIRLPAPPSNFLTDTPSANSQSRNYPTYYLPPQVIFEPTRQALQASSVFFTSLLAPLIHFRIDTTSAVSQYCHSSSDYLPLQAISEPTCQALSSSPIIPHRIHNSSMTPLA